MNGLTNQYSASILSAMLILLTIGLATLFSGNYWGFIPFVIGMLLTKGFRTLSGSNPREIGLITFLGKRTTVTVEGLTLLLDWLPIEIVGVAVFNMQQEDKDFPIENIRSSDNVRMKGTVSISFVPDVGHLDKFDDAKQMEGVKALIDDMLPVWLQKLARGTEANENHDYTWLESHPREMGEYLRNKLENTDPHDRDAVDIANLGVTIIKFSAKLTPSSAKIIATDEDITVEALQRKAELADSETVDLQAEQRHDRYVVRMGAAAPTLKECRDEIIDERLMKEGKVTYTRGNQQNVNFRNTAP